MVSLPPMTVDAAEPDREGRMRRIRRLSRLMAAGCLITSVLLTVAMLFYWIMTPANTLLSQVGMPPVPVADIGIFARTLAFAISMIPLGTLVYGLLSARRCFAAFAGGEIFSSAPIKRLKVFSIAVAASALLKPVVSAALSVLLSASNHAEPKTLVLNVGSDALIALIFAGTVAVIAWVMAEALDIADENKQFV